MIVHADGLHPISPSAQKAEKITVGIVQRKEARRQLRGGEVLSGNRFDAKVDTSKVR